MSPQKINVCKVGLPHFSSTVHQVHCSFIADYLNATQMLKTALFVSLLSYPQSSLSLPCFTFWNCFSYHSRSATVHTCTFPDSRSDSRFYLRFYQVSPFPSLAGAFLPGPAWVCKSLIALQYSSHVKEQGMAEWEGGGRMDRARAQRSAKVMKAVRTYLGQQPSKPVGLAIETCGSQTFLVNSLKRPDFSQ